jgi:alpha-glucosidase
VQDPWERRVPGLGRDPVRTPMPWSDAEGFTGAEPWLPLGDEPTVAEQERDPGSTLSLYRRLLALRRAEDALATGAWEGLRAGEGVLAYVRGGRFLVALNLTGEERIVDMPAGIVALSARGGREGEQVAGATALAGDDALVVGLA